MNYRSFGRDGIQVSEVGLGTWQLGGDWGSVDDETAQQILQTAVDNGVNFLDTADVYGGGLSEQRIRRFVQNQSEKIFVATKLGRRGDPGWPDNFNFGTMRQHTLDSIERLGVESLDLTQLHCIPTEELQAGHVFDHLRRLKDEGLIQRFGASVESMKEALLCLEQDELYSLQIIFNIFRRKPIESIFDKAQEKKVAIVVRLPLASGLLAGKFTKQTTFAEDDHRNYNRDGEAFNVGETFAGLPFEHGVEVANQIKPLVPDNMTMAQMAMRWVLDFEAVSVIIPGATKSRQVEDNAAVSELPKLSDELHAQLQKIYDEQVHEYIRGPY